MNVAIPHKPVLLEEVSRVCFGLEGVLIDCTLGFGSHSYTLLEQNPKLSIIGVDQDKEALEFATNRLSLFKERFEAREGSFGEVCAEILSHQKVSAILADIGVSSYQLDSKARGFSFESPVLDMRMNQKNRLTAKEVINRYSREELEKIFREYGEVREAKKLASLIAESRKKQPFESAKQLADFIQKHSFSKGGIHPATLPFQAIRIEVNQELEQLKMLLDVAKCKTDILIVISFHSLEDRLVKQAFKTFTKDCICPDNFMYCECGGGHALGEILTKKPIVPTLKEIQKNPRSRSSKMRVFRFFS
ncbi:16S rRNA (cytosine(1402)-N(4))-methyltransferase [Helicobacter monodelphidis]|uniref:16S rRNA (cytosine(1402)-N(4))-methyltransferase RsmH n=1 Tax=Helicobacter sp. 15-1451 TaxID=2004995 RepID=UPI000DCE5F3B|nr:16S rRNA (cytosine(1402)-N(4))-methyltransferase RsmH [Helicobacter sp. 15-1451]RAX58591.1 16S rRNA (cytosine(1402)-N(4))-methyltransferase [Helicobacter sp. 15-1451]